LRRIGKAGVCPKRRSQPASRQTQVSAKRLVADAIAPGEAARRGKQSCRTGWLHLPAGSGRGGPVARWESVGGAGWLVGPRPADDVTTPSDDLAVIQDEDRDGPLAAELLDLRAVARIREPGPRPQAPAPDRLISYLCPASSSAFAARPHGWASGGGGLPANFSKEHV
jgi:hypothetical protein